MNEFLLYLLKANAALALFYLGYRLLLRNLTFYSLNRYYFLFALLFAGLYPAVDWLSFFQQRGEIPAGLIEIAPGWQGVAPIETSLSIAAVVEYLFWISAVLFGVRLIVQLSGIRRIHKSSLPASWKAYAYRRSAEDIVPFSFWKNIYMNPARHQENEYEQILKHEYVHVRQLHSIDILLSELAIVLFWFNPFCWLLRSAVRENIEFITDRRVLDSGIDRKNYQYSLLNISTLSNQPVLGNHFNLKNLKKRIMMMNKKRSSSLQLSKYALILPAVLAGSLIFGLSHAGQEQLSALERNKEQKPVAAKGISNEAAEIPSAESSHKKTKTVALAASSKKNPVLSSEKDRKQDTTRKKNKVVIIGQADSSKQKPLYVLDGKMIQGGLDQINTEKIEKVEVHKGKSAIALYGEKAKHGLVLVTTHEGSQAGTSDTARVKAKTVRIEGKRYAPSSPSGFEGKKPLIIVDGVKQAGGSLEGLDPKTIKSMDVLKDESAVKLYGEEAKDGVIRITTHAGASPTLSQD